MDDWRGRLILRKLEEGCLMREAAEAAGITRRAVLKRMHRHEWFAEAVLAARAVGAPERTYRLWLRHPFRGKRPPTGKGHGGRPSFTYGRR
jgi:hypothetical protein